MADMVDEAIIRSLRFALSGPLAGRVVRVLEGWDGGNMLVTTDILCDKPIKPRDVVWYNYSELRLPNEMEVIGAMAL